VPRAIITDRGLEFLSESFRRAGKLVGFAVVNLPGRCPYLKGIVERFFGTLNIRVLSHLEGTTLCRSVETYNPQRRVRFDLGELTQMIVRWIVDDYHQTRHPSLGKTPMVRWTEQVDKFRVRPVPSFRLLVTQLGETVKRKVGNTGISWENHTYASDQLEKLRYRRGGLKKDWEIRIDPYDRGEVFVLDEDRRTWISVPCTQQKTSRGITKFQMRLHMRIARRMTPAGEEVTPAIIEKAMEICATKARKGRARQAQRYLADGALATAVCAKLGFRAVANSNEPATPVAEPVSEMPAPVTTPAKPLSSRQQGSLDDLLAARLRRGKAAA
jgi:putative transposase